MYPDITLHNVDTALLENQRKLLGELSFSADLCFLQQSDAKTTVLIPVSREEAEALSGIVSMLDAWSDEQAAK